jgi:hypothetical protein
MIDKVPSDMKVYSQQQEVFWVKQISEYKNKCKHMSLRDGCGKQKLNYSQLLYWRNRLKVNLSETNREFLLFLTVKIGESVA